MSFTALELQRAGKVALNYFMANEPIDQVGVERPWLAKVMGKRKAFPGAKQYVVEQLRYRYQNNFQWYYGDQQVSFNKRATVEQVQFPWRSCHDGYSLNEDDLFQNGITVNDNAPKTNSGAERLQLTNLFEENNAVLRLGFEEQFDIALTINDNVVSSDAEAIEGLDLLVDTDAGSTVGGLSSTSNAYWENNRSLGLTTGSIVNAMEGEWRKCIRNGGIPDFIQMGSTFLDRFREEAADRIARYTILSVAGQQAGFDPSIGPVQGVSTGLHFQNVPIIWNPVLQDIDTTYDASAAVDWEKRCYMIQSKYMRLRPAAGHDMVTRTPPRVYDRYAYYWGLTWKGAFTISRRNANSVLAVA